MELFAQIRAWRKKFRKKREKIVVLQLPPEQSLGTLAADAAKLAFEKGLTGEDARDFAIRALAKNIEVMIKGDPDHPVGRFIEALDDVLGLAIEAAYQGIKLYLPAKDS